MKDGSPKLAIYWAQIAEEAAATKPATIAMRVFLARLEHRDNRGEEMTMLECAQKIAAVRGTPVPPMRG